MCMFIFFLILDNPIRPTKVIAKIRLGKKATKKKKYFKKEKKIELEILQFSFSYRLILLFMLIKKFAIKEKTNFHNISNISLRVIRRKNCS